MPLIFSTGLLHLMDEKTQRTSRACLSEESIFQLELRTYFVRAGNYCSKKVNDKLKEVNS